ncbi:acyl-CoA dehydrogenase [Microbacterium sp.]|uniref:acyl-CoA dehydrogenase n=1 Tax=Microbacterium sp. TaxID=51671 RepID=UPI003C7760E9
MTTTETPDLEILLGDPHAAEPYSYASIADDDDARRLSPFAENVLAEWGAAAEFVPVDLGGRWADTSDLVTRLRPIFRRDPAVGLGYGLTTLMSAVNVWTGGDDAQKRDVARRLLAGERIAVGFHELDHGNDLLNNECAAEFDGTSWRVRGVKQVVNNIDRAESILIMAKTREGTTARQFSLLLWNKSPESAANADTSRRLLTAGMRGCVIGAGRFDGVAVPPENLIGGDGAAVETALKAFQITRAVIPALAVGAVEAALHETIRYGRDRELYGGTVLDIPHARALVATALADMLVADAMSAATVRALHLSPRECFVLTAACKYLSPRLLIEAMQQISVVAGSTFYARIEPFEIIEKIVRDLAVVPIGHAGETSCLLTILPNLPAWARRAEKTPAADLSLTDLSGDTVLPSLDFGSLTLGAGSSDPLGAVFEDPRLSEALASSTTELKSLVDALAAGYARERAAARALRPDELTTDAPAASFDVARRISLYLAAGAVIGVWLNANASDRKRDAGIAGDPLALQACLLRIQGRLSGRQRPLPDAVVERLVAHAETSVDARQSMGLHAVSVYPGITGNVSTTPNP